MKIRLEGINVFSLIFIQFQRTEIEAMRVIEAIEQVLTSVNDVHEC